MTVADIRKKHQKTIDAAEGPEQRMEAQLVMEREISAFYEAEAGNANRNTWVTKALAKYPQALEAEILAADSEEKAMELAEKSHTNIQGKIDAALAESNATIKKMQDEKEEAIKKGQWGGGQTAGGGQAQSNRPAEGEHDDIIESGWKHLRDETATKSQNDKFMDVRIRDAVGDTLGRIAQR